MQHASTRYGIDDADASEVGVLAEVDRAASALFAPTGLLSAEALKDHVPIDILASAAENGDLFTARLDTGAPVGFALVSLRGGMLYLDQISVHPDQGQRGSADPCDRRSEASQAAPRCAVHFPRPALERAVLRQAWLSRDQTQ